MSKDSHRSTLVMKFGGAAVKSPQNFSQIADLILERARSYRRVAVVVSAMGDSTDQLIGLSKQVNPAPPRRELDMLISVGERISMSLLAMALAAKGREAVSFTGSQAGIITTTDHCDARILDVRPHRLLKIFDEGRIAIVAGFQGMSTSGEVTTLGRGGSDTTAVALAIALKAKLVEFYKDVDGIFSDDPTTTPSATLLRNLSFNEGLDVLSKNDQILKKRCVELAKRNMVPLHIKPLLNSDDPTRGTWIGKDEASIAGKRQEDLFENEKAEM